MKKLKNFKLLLADTYHRWKLREPFNGSIIIAYYTIFSLPGLLVIIVNIAGFFYDKAEITTQLSGQIQLVLGGDTASAIESIIGKASERKETTLSSLLAVAILLFGATGVFTELQQMFNKIWNVEPKPKTSQRIWDFFSDRLFSFGLILVIGFLLLVSLVLSAGLTMLSTWVTNHMSGSLAFVFFGLDAMLSLGIITILFAAIFKFLPDAKVVWKGVWVGALLTSFLFVIAKVALGFYFGQTDLSSTYGAAGSIILIMLWVSYAGLILLFGAEFTHVYITQNGKKEVPTSIAVAIPEDPDKKFV
jgi:membrane protein